MESQLKFKYYDGLKAFAEVVWGNPQAVLQELRQGVEFIDLGAYFPAFVELFSGILRNRKILIRDEYHAAMQELQSDSYSDGAYVTGQPGIGKTLFLIYALVEHLGQKRAVALQLLGGQPFYALFNDRAVAFHPLANGEPLLSCPPMWALCDSNQNVQQPHPTFLAYPSHIRVIQTTSPKASHWKEWSKQHGARPYVMDIWSEEEVVNLATLLDLNAERMTSLAEKLGGAPRTLLEYMKLKSQDLKSSDQKIERTYQRLAPAAVEKCQAMVRGGAQLSIPEDPPPLFYFIRPRTDDGTIIRDEHYLCIPTPTLCRFLAAALQDQDNAIKLAFYRSLSVGAETRSAAGYIYEYWFHSFICAERDMQCQRVVQGSGGDTTESFTLRGTKTLHSDILTAPSFCRPPYYWVVPRSFPDIDSVLVLPTGIFAFQVTLRSEHKSPIKGLQQVRTKLPDDLKILPWSVVFVGPAEETIKLVARQWTGNVLLMKKRLPVWWSSVDTSQEGIPFKVCPRPPDEGDEAVAAGEAMAFEELMPVAARMSD